MKKQIVKYYKKTKHMVPISDELTLIGEESPLERAQRENGIDELYDEHGKFEIVTLYTEDEVNYEYDVTKDKINKFGEKINARN